MTTPDVRRFDLDWVRIAAFGALILYHVGMFYVTWDWHVKSSRASEAIEPLMMLINPWRLLLLFVISGVATRFMADKMSTGQLAWKRLGRLGPPMLLGVFVVVPPQSYFEIVEKIGYAGSYWDFYPHYAAGDGHWCLAGDCLTTPTWNHLWFVAYLLVYTLILAALWPLLKRAPKLRAPMALLLIAPAIYLAVVRMTLRPIFDETHALTDDWYLHAVYFAGFLFGFGVAKFEPFFAACKNWRYAALGVALAAYAAVMAFYAAYPGDAMPPPWQLAIFRVLHETQAWAAIIAVFGFAARNLRRADGPVRRYLTEGVFPFYIAHQTAIVFFAFYLNKQHWPLWVEAALLIALTAASCFMTYEVARRVSWLRPWFGLRPNPTKGGNALERAADGAIS